MQQVALSWLIYRLTGSEWLLGLTAFTGQIPSFVATPWGGALADRMNRHQLLLICQSLAMIQALVLAWLTLTHQITVEGLILLGMISGLINAIDMPTRQAFVVDLIDDPTHRHNAIALNATVMNATRLIGPPLAGLLVYWVGEGVCFLINGLSYIAVLATLARMHLRPFQPAAHQPPMLQHIREGFGYGFGLPPVRALIVHIALMSLLGMPYTVLLPVYAKETFGGDASTLGLMMGASGVGALAASLLLARRQNVLGLGRWLIGASALFGLALAGFSFAGTIPLAMGCLTLTGFGMMMQMGCANIMLQSLTDEDKRGRVMSLYTMAFMGMLPFGSLVFGAAAEHLGVAHTVLVGALLTLCVTGYLITQVPRLRDLTHAIYQDKGLIEPGPMIASTNR